MHNFLFWLFLSGLVIASYTDIKRREVDNWLTLLLIFASFGFVLFNVIFGNDILVFAVLSFIVLFFIMNIFYYGRLWGGGDAQLLFSMFAVFIGASALETLGNILLFVILVLVCGSLWGIFYSGILFFVNFKEARKEFKKRWNKKFTYLILFGVCLLVLSYFEILFITPAILFLIFPILIVFATSVERAFMIKKLSGKDLREGDWLFRDVRVGNRIVRSNWEGLRENEVRLLRHKKEVLVRDGVPFVPGFLIAFLVFYFFRDLIFSLI